MLLSLKGAALPTAHLHSTCTRTPPEASATPHHSCVLQMRCQTQSNILAKPATIIPALQQGCSAKLSASSQLSSKVALPNSVQAPNAQVKPKPSPEASKQPKQQRCHKLSCVQERCQHPATCYSAWLSALSFLSGCPGVFSLSVGLARALDE